MNSKDRLKVSEYAKQIPGTYESDSKFYNSALWSFGHKLVLEILYRCIKSYSILKEANLNGSPKIVSVGCGAAYLEKAYENKYLEGADTIICVDPNQLEFIHGANRRGEFELLDAPFKIANYRSVPELLKSIPSIKGCVLILDWPEPIAPKYDVEAVQLLNPCAVFTTLQYDAFVKDKSGSAGTPELFKILREKYKIIHRTSLIDTFLKKTIEWWQRSDVELKQSPENLVKGLPITVRTKFEVDYTDPVLDQFKKYMAGIIDVDNPKAKSAFETHLLEYDPKNRAAIMEKYNNTLDIVLINYLDSINHNPTIFLKNRKLRPYGLVVGQSVTLHGIISHPHLNGKTGKIQDIDDSKKFQIKLDDPIDQNIKLVPRDKFIVNFASQSSDDISSAAASQSSAAASQSSAAAFQPSFEKSSDDTTSAAASAGKPTLTLDEINTMKVPALKRAAQENKIDTRGFTEKSDYIKALTKILKKEGGYLNNWFHHCY